MTVLSKMNFFAICFRRIPQIGIGREFDSGGYRDFSQSGEE
jgi:hypothetical protein